METFDISPADCLVVHAMSRTKSLREASVLLRCDPASLVRKMHRIASEQGLLQKIKGRWVPTEKGLRMAHWIEEGVHSQKLLLNERPRLRVSSTMWMAEQALIPHLESISVATQKRYVWSIRTPGQGFEEDLINGFSDFAVVCHAPYDPAIAYKKVMAEKWIVIAPLAYKKIDFMKTKPFIRHSAMNPNSIFENGEEIQTTDFLVDNLISVRSAVENGMGWSCVPEILVGSSLKRQSVFSPKIEINYGGELGVWWLRSRKDLAPIAKNISSWLLHALA